MWPFHPSSDTSSSPASLVVIIVFAFLVVIFFAIHTPVALDLLVVAVSIVVFVAVVIVRLASYLVTITSPTCGNICTIYSSGLHDLANIA